MNETAVVQFLTGWRAVDDLEISMAMDREPEETRFPHVILRNLHKSAFILRDPGLAFGTPKIPHPQASDAGVTIVAYQPARFGSSAATRLFSPLRAWAEARNVRNCG